MDSLKLALLPCTSISSMGVSHVPLNKHELSIGVQVPCV